MSCVFFHFALNSKLKTLCLLELFCTEELWWLWNVFVLYRCRQRKIFIYQSRIFARFVGKCVTQHIGWCI